MTIDDLPFYTYHYTGWLTYVNNVYFLFVQIPYIQHTEDNIQVNKIIVHNGWNRYIVLYNIFLQGSTKINSNKTKQNQESNKIFYEKRLIFGLYKI